MNVMRQCRSSSPCYESIFVTREKYLHLSTAKKRNPLLVWNIVNNVLSFNKYVVLTTMKKVLMRRVQPATPCLSHLSGWEVNIN